MRWALIECERMPDADGTFLGTGEIHMLLIILDLNDGTAPQFFDVPRVSLLFWFIVLVHSIFVVHHCWMPQSGGTFALTCGILDMLCRYGKDCREAFS